MAQQSINLDRIQRTSAALVDELQLPGLCVGVVEAHQLSFAAGFGYADVSSKRPAGPELRHRIGSVSKPMTALAVMSLVERNKLKLTDRLTDLLPDLRLTDAETGHADDVTLHHLLTHTSGIGELPTRALLPQATQVLASRDRLDLDLEATYPDGIELEVAPGTKWAYANHGYGLLGEIICRREDADLNDVLTQRIFKPLEMNNTDILDHSHPDLATGYHRLAAESSNTPEDGAQAGAEAAANSLELAAAKQFDHIRGNSLRAAGGVQSTIHDLNRFTSAMLNKAAGIVRPDTFDAMLKPQWCLDDRLVSQGYAFVRTHRFQHRVYAHGGGIGAGWATAFSWVPDLERGLAIFLNLMSTDMGAVESALMRVLLDAPDAEPLPAQHSTPGQLLNSAPGRYECAPGLLTNLRNINDLGRLRIERQAETLVLHSQRGAWAEGARLTPVDMTPPRPLFAIFEGNPEPAYLALSATSHGSVEGIIHGVHKFIRAH